MNYLANPSYQNSNIAKENREQSRFMNVDPTELEGLWALDPQVISTIHSRYFPELFRYARYRLGDEALAEDIAGETLIRMLESIRVGQGPHTSLRGWLFRTASNLVNDLLRKEYAHPIESLPEDTDYIYDAPPSGSYSEQSDRAQLVRDALAKLTLDQQQVITLRFGNGFSLEETANLMEKKINAIKALQFRALASLKRMIAEEKI